MPPKSRCSERPFTSHIIRIVQPNRSLFAVTIPMSRWYSRAHPTVQRKHNVCGGLSAHCQHPVPSKKNLQRYWWETLICSLETNVDACNRFIQEWSVMFVRDYQNRIRLGLFSFCFGIVIIISREIWSTVQLTSRKGRFTLNRRDSFTDSLVDKVLPNVVERGLTLWTILHQICQHLSSQRSSKRHSTSWIVATSSWKCVIWGHLGHAPRGRASGFFHGRKGIIVEGMNYLYLVLYKQLQ